MAVQRSQGAGGRLTLASLVLAVALYLQVLPALAKEEAGISIRHVPDFAALSLYSQQTESRRGCDPTDPVCSTPRDAPIQVPDREGLRRDTKYFIGVQFVTIGVLYLMPESVSSWSDEEKDDYSLSKWWDNVRHPKRDTDDHFINYVLHPYCGAAYFVRARERGYGDRQSFWYSVLLSTAYEFGPEAMFEEPSIQDLVVTPVAGSLLGKYFMHVRGRIESRSADRGYRTRRERWVWALTDPLGAVNHRIDHLLGRDADFRLTPYFYSINRSNIPAADGRSIPRQDTIAGVGFEIRW